MRSMMRSAALMRIPPRTAAPSLSHLRTGLRALVCSAAVRADSTSSKPPQTDPQQATVVRAPARPAAAAHAPPTLHYTPPTSAQLLALYRRLAQPYAPAVSGACRVLSLDVGNRYVGVALSDGTPTALAGVDSRSVDVAALSNLRAEPLCTVERKQLVARAMPLAHVSPNSLHTRRIGGHTDLRGPGSSARRVLQPRTIQQIAAELRALLQQHRCVAVLVGMPLTMAHGLDEQCARTLEFAHQLQHEWAASATTAESTSAAKKPSRTGSPSLPPFQLPALLFWDERLSSAEAREQLALSGVRAHSAAMAQRTDSMAAAVVLQAFLDRMHLVAKQHAATLAASRTP